MPTRWPSLICAGFLLAACEASWLFAHGYGLFFEATERLLVLAALGALVCVVLLAGGLLERALAAGERAQRHVQVYAGTLGFYGLCTALLLTEGRRVRDHALRPLVVALVTAGCAYGAVRALRWGRALQGGPAAHARLASLALAPLALGALVVDARVLPRSYPAFHGALFALAVLGSAFAGVLWPRTRATHRHASVALIVACVLCAWAVARVAHHPNAGFIVREHGALAKQLLALVPVPAHVASAPVLVEQAPSPSSAARIDLRDRDVLIVTVDALRADMLRAYGGRGLTPHMDALAAEGVVFAHAYTPAPHTSYALASLLTSKFVKPVAELSGAPRDHVTLPDLFRRYGYRTAAFYPPAIFFVDGARFSALHGRAFGFEYLKEMYASADLRVAQLAEYLEHAQVGHPVFVWIHLFEPHEPYDPPASWTARGSARSLYEGEVAEADRAFGELVATFRAKKPNGTVVLAADHGEEFGEHGGSFHGTTLYEEQARVPLVWSSPGALAARVSQAPVELVDVGSTLLATAGVPRDPRMRGDDLSAALLGDDGHGPRHAFASVEDRTMVTDGAWKVVCAAHEPHCQLFDLVNDPGETRSVAAQRPDDVARLRTALDAFVRSIPEAEALAVEQGVAFPEALARAELGVAEALPEVVSLLDDARPAVRAKAVRILGERNVSAQRDALLTLLERDPDEDVRSEAAIAALALGQGDAARAVVRTLTTRAPAERAERAALVLARSGDPVALPPLTRLAADTAANEAARALAVEALGHVHEPGAQAALTALLGEPRLGARAADVLREGGFHESRDALARALADQRYPAVRSAQARALFSFADARALPLSLRFLGMETSLPGGLALLAEFGQFARPRRDGGALSVASSLRQGSWQCVEDGCAPGQGAELLLSARAQTALRVVVAVAAAPEGASLTLAGQAFALRGGPEQVSALLPAGARRAPIAVTASAGVRLALAMLVPAEPEIPPPAPEPWDADAGVNEPPARDH